MTQAEMAALVRIPLLTLTRWEAGSLDLKAKVLHGLLAAQAKNKKGRRGAGLPFDHDQPPPPVLRRHRDTLDVMAAPLHHAPHPEGLPAVPAEMISR